MIAKVDQRFDVPSKFCSSGGTSCGTPTLHRGAFVPVPLPQINEISLLIPSFHPQSAVRDLIQNNRNNAPSVSCLYDVDIMFKQCCEIILAVLVSSQRS